MPHVALSKTAWKVNGVQRLRYMYVTNTEQAFCFRQAIWWKLWEICFPVHCLYGTKTTSTAKKLFDPQELSSEVGHHTSTGQSLRIMVCRSHKVKLRSHHCIAEITYLKKKHFRPMSALAGLRTAVRRPAQTYIGLMTFCSLSICVGARDLCILYLTLYYTGECNTEAHLKLTT